MPGVISKNIVIGAASMVLGTIIFLLLFDLQSRPDSIPTRDISHLTPTHPGMVLAGRASANHTPLRVTLDQYGQALVRIPLGGHRLQDLAFLSLSIPNIPENGAAVLSWQVAVKGRNKRVLLHIQGLNKPSTWLYMGDVEGWKGSPQFFDVVLTGTAGTHFTVAEVGLYSFSKGRALKSILSDATVFTQWSQRSVNGYQPGRNITAFEPTVSMFTLLAICCLTAYFLLLVTWPGSRPFQPAIPIALFLFFWVLMDLNWQTNLLRQVELSQRTFAGKSSNEKLLAGPDSQIFAFTQLVNRLIPNEAKPRIFIAGSHEYTAMRSAYHLYPNNVFWERNGPELPAPSLLLQGDYIALLNPSKIQLDSEKGILHFPGKKSVKVKVITSQPVGHLLRVL